MRITHIIPALTKGGAERVLIELANAFAGAGHQVTVVTAFPADPALGRDALAPEIRYVAISPSGRPRLRRYAVLLPWVWRNRRWILEQDVIHCHLTFASVAGTAVKWLARLSGRGPRVVETFHAVGMPIPTLTRSLFRTLAAGRDGCAFMAEDRYWRGFIDSHPKLPTAIIPNGISVPPSLPAEAARHAARERLGMPADARWVVGTIGRIIAERKPLAILESFAAIARRIGPGVHFLMGGEGPMLAEIAAEAKRLGLEGRLHLPGLVRNPSEALAAMDLYVSVNVGSITGIAGLEAAAAAVPVIAVQALDRHDSGSTDWIWSDPRPERVAEHAAELLLADEERETLRVRQREHVRQCHSSEAMAAAYAALYDAAGAATNA
jgi:glycosyltransferase involved in cell wall biosynthesis